MKRNVVVAVCAFSFFAVSAVPLAGQPTQRPQGTALNFVDARLSEVIRSLALTLGLNVVLTDVPDKRITFTTAQPVQQADVGAILESILERRSIPTSCGSSTRRPRIWRRLSVSFLARGS